MLCWCRDVPQHSRPFTHGMALHMGIICTLKRLACHIAAMAVQVQRANVASSYAWNESSLAAQPLPPACTDKDEMSLYKQSKVCIAFKCGVIFYCS